MNFKKKYEKVHFYIISCQSSIHNSPFSGGLDGIVVGESSKSGKEHRHRGS